MYSVSPATPPANALLHPGSYTEHIKTMYADEREADSKRSEEREREGKMRKRERKRDLHRKGGGEPAPLTSPLVSGLVQSRVSVSSTYKSLKYCDASPPPKTMKREKSCE